MGRSLAESTSHTQEGITFTQEGNEPFELRPGGGSAAYVKLSRGGNPVISEKESKRRNQMDRQYDKGFGHGRRDREDQERRGGKCFLTTACAAAAGLGDECDELTVLRRFRDLRLVAMPGGAEAIRRYYKIAPLIVDAVNGSRRRREEWRRVLGIVRASVKLIRDGQFDDAFATYGRMASDLERRYLTDSR